MILWKQQRVNRSPRQKHWLARALSPAHHDLGGQQSVLGAAAMQSAVLASTSQSPTMSTSHHTSVLCSTYPRTSSLTSPWPGSPVVLSTPPYSPGQALPLALALALALALVPQVRIQGFPRAGRGDWNSRLRLRCWGSALGFGWLSLAASPDSRWGESSNIIRLCEILAERISGSLRSLIYPRMGICVIYIQQGLLSTKWEYIIDDGNNNNINTNS